MTHPVLPDIPSAKDVLDAAKRKGLGPYQLCRKAGVSRSAVYKAAVKGTKLHSSTLEKLIRVINEHEGGA